MDKVNIILLYLITSYISFILFKSYSIISKKEYKLNVKNILLIILSSLLFLLNSLYNISEYKIFVSLILQCGFYKIIFKENTKNCIINTIIIVIITTGLELFYSIFLTIFTSIFKLTFSDTIIIKTILSLIIFQTYDLLMRNYKFNTRVIKLSENTCNIFSNELILVLSLIIINIVMVLRYKLFKNYSIIVMAIFCLIYIILTIIKIVKNRIIINKLKAKNKELSSSYKMYSKTVDQFRELRHNLKNDLYGLKSMLPQEEQNYINQVINKYSKNYGWISNLEDLPTGVQGLIYIKINEAKMQKVNIVLNNKESFKVKEKDLLELNEMLGILIDNAIEAVSNSKNKLVYIDINSNNSITNIKIINSINNIIDVNSLYKKGYSTKKIKSGIGLNYISKIKNKNIKLSTQIVNNLFISSINYKNE